MPYEWSNPTPKGAGQRLTLWPYRSLLRRDFVVFMTATATLILIPLLAVLGTGAMWYVLPFFTLMFSGLWWAISLSYRRGEVLEELTFDETNAALVRHNPNGRTQTWRANRYWVTVHLHPTDGPVENYITLRGGDREVEIGAFLDVTERAALYDDLKRAFS
ncbi:DUF2244 domain-containing protein [Loktanella sp. S4079]|uniref:DUF2244 domain-containing protein n=1 Tax=Loktanella sp. S4079 TaxID=579483 RepID=UPI0005F9D5B5|nr:DUF2244 domain-containing protein [Loktanella sp. S4079]KJZ20479.1 integral membrane protein [Loktanella sp. S4079]